MTRDVIYAGRKGAKPKSCAVLLPCSMLP